MCISRLRSECPSYRFYQWNTGWTDTKCFNYRSTHLSSVLKFMLWVKHSRTVGLTNIVLHLEPGSLSATLLGCRAGGASWTRQYSHGLRRSKKSLVPWFVTACFQGLWWYTLTVCALSEILFQVSFKGAWRCETAIVGAPLCMNSAMDRVVENHAFWLSAMQLDFPEDSYYVYAFLLALFRWLGFGNNVRNGQNTLDALKVCGGCVF